MTKILILIINEDW